VNAFLGDRVVRIGGDAGTLPRVEVQQMLGGRYKLLDELGSGGMAVVWRARDEVLGRPVAVKLLAGRYANDPQSRARIRDEARAAATLSHPNIAQVYDFGESDESGFLLPYVVMELINGPTLQQHVALGPLPPGTAFRICSQVAAALAAAHADGLVHRDIKPANVMVTPAGAKVVDFGIAAAAGPAGPDEILLGTPAYLAPERLTGGDVAPASDVYALGVLLYRLLANESPWSVDTTTQMLTAHVYVEPTPLPRLAGVPLEVSELVDRCLRKNPAERPSAAQASAILASAADAAAVRGLAAGGVAAVAGGLAAAAGGLAAAAGGLAGAAGGLAGMPRGLTEAAQGSADAGQGFAEAGQGPAGQGPAGRGPAGQGPAVHGSAAHGLGAYGPSEAAGGLAGALHGSGNAPQGAQIFGADTTSAVRAGVPAAPAIPLRRASIAAQDPSAKPAKTGAGGVPVDRERKRRALIAGGGVAVVIVVALLVWWIIPGDSARRSDAIADQPSATTVSAAAAAVNEPSNPAGVNPQGKPGRGVKGLPPIADGTQGARSAGAQPTADGPAPAKPTAGGPTAPGGGPVVTTDAAPATTDAPTGTKTLSSAGGTVEALCSKVAKATLVSWDPKSPYQVERVSAGPVVAAVIVFKHGLSRIRMTVTCVAGIPTAVSLPL
jgi:serine/threonine-protein kinase